MAKPIFVDQNREMNITKIHDGEGNLYCFNIPPSCSLQVKDILKHGQLIAFKLKGESCKRIDSSSDPFYRHYQAITAMEFKDSGLSRLEFNELLTEKKKTAPVPGREKAYPPYEEPENNPIFNASDLTNQLKGATKMGRFRDQEIYRTDIKRPPFALTEKACAKCKAIIPGKHPVSITDGKFTRFQTFVPFGHAKITVKGSHDWICGNCLNGVTSPPIAGIPTAIKSEGMRAFKGGTTFTFHEQDGRFFYKKNEIIKNPNGAGGKVCKKLPCEECGEMIDLMATISYHDGLPYLVSANKGVDHNAVTIRPKSQSWKHITCPIKASPPPPPPEQVLPSLPTEAPDIPPPSLPAPSHVGKPKIISYDQRDLFAKLEEMATDVNVDDKIFRGAAWMLCRTITGGDGNEHKE